MMIFVARRRGERRGDEREREKRGDAREKQGRKERERKKRRERDEAGRASSLGPEKLSEIMSEEIGSLARG